MVAVSADQIHNGVFAVVVHRSHKAHPMVDARQMRCDDARVARQGAEFVEQQNRIECDNVDRVGCQKEAMCRVEAIVVRMPRSKAY
jgi:hypothetical protein